jgi:hypothetical protein
LRDKESLREERAAKCGLLTEFPNFSDQGHGLLLTIADLHGVVSTERN